MKKCEIFIHTEGFVEPALIEVHRTTAELRLIIGDTKSKIYTSHDCFESFGLLRADYPNIKFLCKGAKRNVYPSTMSSQMSAGLVAYEVTMGKRTDTENLVRIFDYEDTDLTNDINLQREFYYKWYESVTGLSRSSYIAKFKETYDVRNEPKRV